MSESRVAVQKEDIDILTVTEPYSKGGKICGLPSGAVLKYKEVPNPMAAICVATGKASMVFLEHLSTSHTCVAEISTSGAVFILIAQYYQHAHPIEPYLRELDEALSATRGQHHIIMTDSNAKHPRWGSPILDDRGVKMADFADDQNLILLNKVDQGPTFQHLDQQGTSYIDLTLVSHSFAHRTNNWKIRRGFVHSDHALITIDLVWEASNRIPTEEATKLNYHKANWTKICEDLGSTAFVHEGCPETDSVNITKSIMDVVAKHVPAKAETKFRTRWWTSELSELRSEYRRLRRAASKVWGTDRRERLEEATREAKLSYYSRMEETKRASWETFVKETLSLDPWRVPYKIARGKLRPATVLAGLKRPDGTSTNTWKDTAELLLQQLLPDDNPEEDNPDHRELRRTFLEDIQIVQAPPFLAEELDEALGSTNPNKAPGPDGISPNVLIKAQDVLRKDLLKVYNTCLEKNTFPKDWKKGEIVTISKGAGKDPKEPKSYRPLCLLGSLSKVYKRMLNKRLCEVRIRNDPMDEQYGYCPGRSTEMAINHVIEYVKSGEEKYTNLLFVDISGAFDNLWWPSLFKAIADIGTPQYLLNVLKSYVTERSVTYRSKFAQTQKDISKGCPQGSVLGPTLWNIMMDTLVRDLRGTAGCVAYADDLVVMYKGHSRRQLCNTAAAVSEVLNKWCITNRLTISPSKSAILQFGGDFNRNNPVKCKLFGRYVKTVQEWTYLGVVLDNKLLFRQHVKATNTKASTVINTIATIANRQYGIRPATLNVLYQGVYVSMVSYAASVWAPSVLRNKRQQYFVNAAQRRALVLLYGGYNSTSWEAMALTVGVLPMHLKLAQRAARYFLKKEDHGRISQLLDCQVEVFTRTRIEEILRQAWNEIWTTTCKGDHLRAIFSTVQDRLRCNGYAQITGIYHFNLTWAIRITFI